MTSVQLMAQGPSSVLMRYIVSYKDLTDAAVAQTLTLDVLPKGSIVLGTRIKSAVAFTGGGSSSCTVSVGSAAAATTTFAPAFDIFQAVADTTAQMTSGWKAGTYAADSLTATFTADVNVNLLTNGVVYIDVEMFKLQDLTATGPSGNTGTSGGLL